MEEIIKTLSEPVTLNLLIILFIVTALITPKKNLLGRILEILILLAISYNIFVIGPKKEAENNKVVNNEKLQTT